MWRDMLVWLFGVVAAGVVRRALQLLQNEKDEAVMLAGCEYWSALCEASVCKDRRVSDLFKSKLPVYVTQSEPWLMSSTLISALAVPCRLLPLLIQRMRYSEEELADLPERDVSDEHIPDSAEDVRPFTYKVKDEEDEPDRGPVSDVRMLLPLPVAAAALQL